MAVDFKRSFKKCPPFYHGIKSVYIYLNRRSRLCEVPIDICTNPMGFSFATDGWNHLIEQLREFDREGNLRVKDSVLYKFHQQYQPEDMSEITSSAGFHVAFKPGLSIYPWGSFNIEKSNYGGVVKDAGRSRFYGPSTLRLVENDFYNLQNLYKNMKVRGYRPWYFKNSFIGGVFLEKEDGKKKFVVLQGNHRTAILSHLGHKKILVRYLSGYYKCIREKDMNNWFYVKSGRCSTQDAIAYFDSFFKLSGVERVSKMELLEERNSNVNRFKERI